MNSSMILSNKHLCNDELILMIGTCIRMIHDKGIIKRVPVDRLTTMHKALQVDRMEKIEEDGMYVTGNGKDCSGALSLVERPWVR